MWSSSKPTRPSSRSAIPFSQSAAIVTVSQPSTSVGGALGVAEVGEEEANARPADAGAVGAGEAGQVADVGQVGDQHPVQLFLGQQRLEAVAAAAHQEPAPSSPASSSSASR